MKKLLFLLLLSPVAYPFYTEYCEWDSYNYLKLEHNYWDTKKDREPRFKVIHGNTYKNLKDFHATTKSIKETFFGITAFDDENKTLYNYNYETNILIIALFDTAQDEKKDNYNIQKQKLDDGTFIGSAYRQNYVYKCVRVNEAGTDKRNKKDIPSEAPFKD